MTDCVKVINDWFQKTVRDAYDTRHDADTERVVVRIHDVAARGAGPRAQDGGVEAGAVTLRRRGGAPAPARVTPAGRRRRRARAAGRPAAHQQWARGLAAALLAVALPCHEWALTSGYG